MIILIVEDDKGLAELITEKVVETGHEAVSVHSAKDAREWLNENMPYMMLLDYSLPDMNAIELLNQLQKKEQLLPPFIVSTGQGDERIAVEMMKLGARDYIVKDSLFLNRLPGVIKRVARELENENKRKQAEEKLRESEANLQAIMNNTTDIIASYDREIRLVAYNSACSDIYRRLFGIEIQQGLCTIDLFPEETRGVWIANNERALAGESFTIEFELPSAAAGQLTFESSFHPMRHGNEVVGFLTTTRDITDRKRAEAEKEALEIQNRQLQKSESLGRMAGAVAHHFNNRLAVVIGSLELALMDVAKGVPPKARLTSAINASREAAKLSRMMITYLGQSFDKRESLDLSDTCIGSIPLIQGVLPENILLDTDFPLPGPIVSTNNDFIQQILTNLVTNACEAIDKKNGAVAVSVKTVSAAEVPLPNRFPVDWESQGNACACLEVTDTGCGIEGKDIEKLFDPFYSTKFTGRGMGLAVVLGIVKTHNGVLSVESNPGQGSTFRIFFPVCNEELLRTAPEPDRAEAISSVTSASLKDKESGTVLVVEDEEMVRNMAASMLESFGYEVLTAKDGIDALEVYGRNKAPIIFVLCDLTMPRMSGWETLAELRKLDPGIRLILASGYDLVHVMEGDHSELPNAFLSKPYNIKTLSKAIEIALGTKKGV